MKVKRIAQQDIIKDDQIRSPGAKLLLGTDTTLIQNENGVSYKFDLTKELFNYESSMTRLASLKYS